jgi:hypothetical protein
LNPGPAYRSEAAPALGALLRDPSPIVRISAAVGLIGMGFRQPPGEYVEPLEAAKQMFRARAALNADDAEQDMAAGRFYLLLADPASAVVALETSLKLDPAGSGAVPVGRRLRATGESDGGEADSGSHPHERFAIPKAQRLLKAIAAQNAGH